jgi:hypothetical protein
MTWLNASSGHSKSRASTDECSRIFRRCGRRSDALWAPTTASGWWRKTASKAPGRPGPSGSPKPHSLERLNKNLCPENRMRYTKIESQRGELFPRISVDANPRLLFGKVLKVSNARRDVKNRIRAGPGMGTRPVPWFRGQPGQMKMRVQAHHLLIKVSQFSDLHPVVVPSFRGADPKRGKSIRSTTLK